ncbi:precorrin-6y C5,15-methyltransferase (decarboxylating) subunit CbiE [Streptomyces stramineus]
MSHAPVTVVGIGADGWPGLAPGSQEALRRAEVTIGGPRQLDLLPPTAPASASPGPPRCAPPCPACSRSTPRRVCVLASGDPMFFGIGRTLLDALGDTARLRVMPHPSSVSYACARLGWPLDDTDVLSLVGRPLAALTAALHPGRRLLLLSAGAGTPPRWPRC